MGWTPFILTSAFFLALYDLGKKASVRNNAVLPVLLGSTLCGCVVFSLSVYVRGDWALVCAAHPRTIGLAAIKSLIVAASWVFTFCGLRTLPLTLATPIRASSPALVLLLAIFLYGEIPSAVQAVGMALVFTGYMAFSWAGRHEGIDFWHTPAIGFAFAGTLLSAVSSIWDKYVFQVAKEPIEVIQFYFQVGLVVVYAVLLVGQRACKLRHDRFEWRWTIPFVGLLLTLADWFYFNGVAQDGVAISVASLMRRFSVAITFILGALFFHERNLRRKGLALALVLAGIALLCLKS